MEKGKSLFSSATHSWSFSLLSPSLGVWFEGEECTWFLMATCFQCLETKFKWWELAESRERHCIKGQKSSIVIKADAIIVNRWKAEMLPLFVFPFLPCLAHWVLFLERHKRPGRLSRGQLNFNENKLLWFLTDPSSNYSGILESTTSFQHILQMVRGWDSAAHLRVERGTKVRWCWKEWTYSFWRGEHSCLVACQGIVFISDLLLSLNNPVRTSQVGGQSAVLWGIETKQMVKTSG